MIRIRTSAKENKNLEETMERLVTSVLKKLLEYSGTLQPLPTESTAVISLDSAATVTKKRSCCFGGQKSS